MESGKSSSVRSWEYCSGNNILKRSTVNKQNSAKSPNEMGVSDLTEAFCFCEHVRMWPCQLHGPTLQAGPSGGDLTSWRRHYNHGSIAL